MSLAVYDTFGNAYTGAQGTPAWNHNIGSSGAGLLAFIQTWMNSSTVSPTCTAGGTAMTQLGVIRNYQSATDWGSIFAFGLLNVPAGPIALSASISATVYDVAASSLSYANCSGFGTVTTTSGTGNPSMSVTAAVNQPVAQAFGGYTTTFTAYNPAIQRNFPFASGVNIACLMGSAVGSTTFTATGSQPWGGIAVPVL